MSLLDEIAANYANFSKDWHAAVSTRISALSVHDPRFLESYTRLTTFQAWRSGVIEPTIGDGCAAFFVEAQNDALVSHVHAALGAWRTALKSLRSCIENILLCLYFKDHPVELSLWESGHFRIAVSARIEYFRGHPRLRALPEPLSGIPLIQQEYSNLSQAVHSSSKDFRMTTDGKALALWKTDIKDLGIWATHERRTVQGLNLLLISIFGEQLSGTAHTALRSSLGLVIPKDQDADLRKFLNVKIKR